MVKKVMANSKVKLKNIVVEEVWKLPDNWGWVKLGVLADIIMGQSPPGKTYNADGKGLPFFQGKADFGEFHPLAKQWCSDPKKIAEPQDILLSIRAPVGPTNLATEKCCIGRGLAAIRPNPNVRVKYLLFALRTLEPKLSKQGTGSTFGAVSKQQLLEFLIPIPHPNEISISLFTQDNISFRIETLLNDIRTVQKIINTMSLDVARIMTVALKVSFDNLKTHSEMQRIGSDRVAKVIPGQHISSNMYTNDPIGHPYLTGPADFGSKYPLISKWTKFPKIFCQPGDVLFTVKGSGVGKINLAPSEHKAAIGRQLMAIRPNIDNIITDFLYYALLGRFSEFQELRQGAAIPGIRKEHLEAIEIPLPNRITQERVVTHINSINSEIEEMRKILSQDVELLKKMEQSILMRAFRGEL
jgi:type I restriction enzyme S subunit